ncbi:MAG: succinylglutamate desuccinylase/aspartoacylase family protein [Chloracidobacterium sp.]|nr:succinylglutamate desuccinylase/aspartoacylase family protein [Chloracidobacterium sp.]
MKSSSESPVDGVGEHLIGAFIGNPSGPTLIVIGSLHGNEPGGSAALSNLSKQLNNLTGKLKGRVYFLAGNTRALHEGVRFVDTDLNRHWTPKNMSSIGTDELLETSEGVELTELDHLLDGILITAMDEVFVVDLHSTSSDGMPFATVGDTLRNRAFAKKFPVTILLGIEEQLDGTMLEYLNNAGAVTMGFEGGQHLSPETVTNHEALVWLAMANSGVLDAADLPAIETSRHLLDAERRGARLFEVRFRHEISEKDEFEMLPGFKNFDRVTKGQILARDKNGPITAIESGLLLMPLYQKLGNDGFFIGREISPFWLWLSGVLRNIGIQKIIHILPGVVRDPDDPGTLIVNTSVARLFPLQVFHLLGFRRRRWIGNNLVVSRRKHDTDAPFKWKGM